MPRARACTNCSPGTASASWSSATGAARSRPSPTTWMPSTAPFRTMSSGSNSAAALSDAALRFRREPRTERRHAVLIIPDNMGMRTRREGSVVDEFWESDAILSGLIVRNPAFQALRTVGVILAPQNLALQAGMKGIAEKTGGDSLTANEPGTAFQEAMRRIRTRYSLYYALPEAKPGTTRAIRVDLAPDAAKRFPKARLRARTGYVVPNAGKSAAGSR